MLALAKRQYLGRRATKPMNLLGEYESYEFTKPALMVVDEDSSTVIWEEDKLELVEALYSSVSFKVAGLENLIDAILNQ